MKTPITAQKTSRRKFAKSVAATLVTAPLAIPITANSMSIQTRSKEPQEPQNQSKRRQEPGRPETRHEHIPPLGVGSGSCYIELYHKLTRLGDGMGDRPQRYTAPQDPGRRYGDIYSITVLTEEEHEFERHDYYFRKGERPQLKLWFQNWNKGTNAWDNLDNYANVVIKGGVEAIGSQLLIEIENPYGGGDTLQHDKEHHKAYRKEKHRHKGRGQDKAFRIGQWEIADSGGVTFPGLSEAGKDGYYFLVSFYNPDP